MRPRLLILLLFFGSFSFAQQSLTTEQINRLADAGKIYGYVKYFHPFLQYKDLNWDSAFAANVEYIIKAKNKDEYATVLKKLFSCLDDGITTIWNVNTKNPEYKGQDLTFQIKDSILYIQMNDAPFMTTDAKFYDALQNLAKVKGAVIDMRAANSAYYKNMLGDRAYFDWSSSWFKGTYIMPSERTVSYNGFPGEGCQGCTNAAFKENAVTSVAGELNKEIPLVFIVSNEDEVPLMAVKLQEEGKAQILQQGGRDLLPGSSIYFYIADSLLIQLRTSEAVNADGSLLIVHPNVKFKGDEYNELITDKAKQLLAGNKQLQSVSSTHPMLTEHLFSFVNEPAYPSIGYRMLAAAKMFSVVNHFYPSRSSMQNDWDQAYKTTIPRFINAKDSIEYWQAVSQLHAMINDSHGFVSKSNEWFSLKLNPLIQERGNYEPPFFTRLVENRIIVTDFFNDSVCKKMGISKGDIILSINGKDPIEMIESERKYQNAGNKESQDFYLSSFILFGNKDEVKKLKVQQVNGKIKEIMMPVFNEFRGNWLMDNYVAGMFSQNHAQVLKMLTKDIGYADLTSPWNQITNDSLIRMVKKAKGFILDMRGYPHNPDEILLSLLDSITIKIKPVVAKRISGDMPASSPRVIKVERWGLPYIVDEQETLNIWNERRPNTGVELVILINGSAQSAAESLTNLFRNACNATIIGTPTAGANSFFVNYFIPGDLRLWLSGMPIERSGIQPDIFIQPTIKGLQAGKDEVLERAIKYLQTGK